MKIKEMIETVISKGKTEDMLKLNDMLNELICDLKVENPKLYREYKKELYDSAYGLVMMDGMAIDIVEEDVLGTQERISFDYKGILKDLKPGMSILVDDGFYKLVVEEAERRNIK